MGTGGTLVMGSGGNSVCTDRVKTVKQCVGISGAGNPAEKSISM